MYIIICLEWVPEAEDLISFKLSKNYFHFKKGKLFRLVNDIQDIQGKGFKAPFLLSLLDLVKNIYVPYHTVLVNNWYITELAIKESKSS